MQLEAKRHDLGGRATAGVLLGFRTTGAEAELLQPLRAAGDLALRLRMHGQQEMLLWYENEPGWRGLYDEHRLGLGPKVAQAKGQAILLACQAEQGLEDLADESRLRGDLRPPRADGLGAKTLGMDRRSLSEDRILDREPGVVAYAFAQAEAARGPHELALFAAPEHRGRYETALLEWLLKRLRSKVPHNVRALVSAGYPEALTAAWNLGFRTQQVLDQMVLDLEPGAPTEPEAA